MFSSRRPTKHRGKDTDSSKKPKNPNKAKKGSQSKSGSASAQYPPERSYQQELDPTEEYSHQEHDPGQHSSYVHSAQHGSGQHPSYTRNPPGYSYPQQSVGGVDAPQGWNTSSHHPSGDPGVFKHTHQERSGFEPPPQGSKPPLHHSAKGVDPFDFKVKDWALPNEKPTGRSPLLFVRVLGDGNDSKEEKAAPPELVEAVSDIVNLALDMLRRKDLKPFQQMAWVGSRCVETWTSKEESFIYPYHWLDEDKMQTWLSTLLGRVREHFFPIKLMHNESDTAPWYGLFDPAGLGEYRQRGGYVRLAPLNGGHAPQLPGQCFTRLIFTSVVFELTEPENPKAMETLAHWRTHSRNTPLHKEIYEAYLVHWALTVVHELTHALTCSLSGHNKGTVKVMTPKHLVPQGLGNSSRGEAGRLWELRALGGWVTWRQNHDCKLPGAGSIWLLSGKDWDAVRVDPKAIKAIAVSRHETLSHLGSTY